MTTNKHPLELLDSVSPEKRAQLLKALKQRALQSQRPEIPRRPPGQSRAPLSPAQNRLWLLEQLRPGGHAYNELSALRLTGALDVSVLERCLHEIARRHEALRTTFVADGGEPVQVIAAEPATRLRVVDLGDRAEREAELERLILEEERRPFDLGRGPLLRTTLVKLDARQSVLVVSAHHLVLDGWSIGVFQRELAALYAAFAAGRPSPLPELPIQYADYALWQRQAQGDEALKPRLEYWTRQLAGLPPLLELPVANSRPDTESFAGAREHFTLDERLAQELAALGRRANASLFMTLLAAFQALLYRYTGQTDIPVGTVVANREAPELEPLIGFFVNTLVMRGDLGGDPTFAQLLERVRGTAVAAYEHQALPFEKLVEALRPERSLAYNPLFQVMLILQNTPSPEVALPGLTMAPLETGSITAKYDLALVVDETPRGLRCHWEYNTDLFDAGTTRRLTGHLETLLRGVVEDPDRPVSALPLLPAAEERRVLVEWNQTDAPLPPEQCLHQLFESQAARTPDAEAVAHAGQALGYRELNERANQLAHSLRDLGIGPGALVGVCLHRSFDLVVALLGILKAGGAYVPLDPSYPPLRLAAMVEDSKAAVLLTHAALRERLPPGGAKVICLDEDQGEIARRSKADGAPSAGADDLAYVIYTSGSTGQPKGVMVTHRNAVHSTAARWEHYRQPISAFLLLSSFAFDSSVAGIYWTLSRGGTLVLPEGEGMPEVRQISRLLAAHRVSHLLCIPSVHALLLQQAQPQALALLKVVIVAGEACPPQLVEQHHRALAGCALFNEYGPTEATVWCTVQRLEAGPSRANVPIGRPIANARVYVLDAHRRPVPIGVPGELCVGGAGVARGYLGRSELTEARFVRPPFGGEGGARLYRTGDLARYLPDGTLELLGRIDDQVKIRGSRVELGEVEAALLRFPGVQEAVAAARDDGRGNKRLIAYVVAGGDGAFPVAGLREAIREQLPAFAVPSDYVLLERLPRLPNGKVDRKALPAREAHPAEQAPGTAGWTELQRAIAALWKEVIDVEPASLDDNFFQVGGDSLSVVRVSNRLREMVDKDVAITDLFKHPTIRSLSDFLER